MCGEENVKGAGQGIVCITDSETMFAALRQCGKTRSVTNSIRHARGETEEVGEGPCEGVVGEVFKTLAEIEAYQEVLRQREQEEREGKGPKINFHFQACRTGRTDCSAEAGERRRKEEELRKEVSFTVKDNVVTIKGDFNFEELAKEPTEEEFQEALRGVTVESETMESLDWCKQRLNFITGQPVTGPMSPEEDDLHDLP